MKRFFKIMCYVGILFTMSSCAYQPIYGTKKSQTGKASETSASKGLSEIEIANIPDRVGQILRNDLIDRINYNGYSSETRYLLQIGLAESRSDLGLKRDGSSSLYVYKITANVTLSDKKTGKVLKRFTTSSESTVNVIREQFSILAASETGRKRALKLVADGIINRLSIYFSTHLTEEKVKR